MTFVAQDTNIFRQPKPGTPDWYDWHKTEKGSSLDLKDIIEDSLKGVNTTEQGIKDNKDKLFYELDFRFIQAMAQRMADNKKDKYPRWNWKKSINIEELKQATFRHMLEVMEDNYDDEGKEFDHLVALACNAMMLRYRLKAEKEIGTLVQNFAQLKK